MGVLTRYIVSDFGAINDYPCQSQIHATHQKKKAGGGGKVGCQQLLRRPITTPPITAAEKLM